MLDHAQGETEVKVITLIGVRKGDSRGSHSGVLFANSPGKEGRTSCLLVIFFFLTINPDVLFQGLD